MKRRIALALTLAALAGNAGAWGDDQEHFYEYCKSKINSHTQERKKKDSASRKYGGPGVPHYYSTCISELAEKVLGLRKAGATPEELDACKRAHKDFCKKEYRK